MTPVVHHTPACRAAASLHKAPLRVWAEHLRCVTKAHHLVLVLAVALLCGVATAAPLARPEFGPGSEHQPCAGQPPVWQPLAQDAWWWAGASGAANADNRGAVTHLVLVRHQGRLWLLGAGPTPAFARRMGCHVQQQFGQSVADVLVPWARGEQALGLVGWAKTGQWAHSQVVATMRRQCPTCLAALRLQLQGAASDLGERPIRLPGRLSGQLSGRLPSHPPTHPPSRGV